MNRKITDELNKRNYSSDIQVQPRVLFNDPVAMKAFLEIPNQWFKTPVLGAPKKIELTAEQLEIIRTPLLKTGEEEITLIFRGNDLNSILDTTEFTSYIPYEITIKI